MRAQTEKEVKRMKQKCGVDIIKEHCRRRTLNRILEKYIKSCRYDPNDDGGTVTKQPSKKNSGRFPNIAGFCGFFRISIEDLENLASEFPDEISYLYAIFEDEALNSGLPPAVLSAYLKKRLGYEKDDLSRSAAADLISIRFEHDIYDDGK